MNRSSVGYAAVLAAVVCSACGSSSDGASAGAGGSAGQVQETTEIFSWWVSPGEAEALQALVDLHKTMFPGERVYNAAAASGVDAKKILGMRLAASDPPDLFQQNAYEMQSFIAANPGKVEPLDDLFAAENLAAEMVPEVLDNVTVDGHIYALPVNIHRENSLFYNMQMFKDNGLRPPSTQAEFLSVCAALKKKGIAPVAVSTSQGWIVIRLFYALALGSMGGQAFADYFSGKEPLDEAAFGKAIDVLDEVLLNYINADANAENFGWTEATKAVFNGEAAMLLHGDWAKAYFVQLGWTPNTDFGVVGSPGANDVFLYGTDVFGVPVGAKHRTSARDFLTTIASTDGQVAFNTVKGSSPMRLDVPLSKFDSMGQEVIESFKSAKTRLAVNGKPAWDAAFVAFAADHDKAALIQAFKDNPPGG